MNKQINKILLNKKFYNSFEFQKTIYLLNAKLTFPEQNWQTGFLEDFIGCTAVLLHNKPLRIPFQQAMVPGMVLTDELAST